MKQSAAVQVWLLELNVLLAFMWSCVVIIPWFFLNHHSGTLLGIVLSYDTPAMCPGPRCQADGRGPETRTPFYYAGFGVENGDFENFEMNYLLAIALTVFVSFWYIMSEVSKRKASTKSYWEQGYPCDPPSLVSESR